MRTAEGDSVRLQSLQEIPWWELSVGELARYPSIRLASCASMETASSSWAGYPPDVGPESLGPFKRFSPPEAASGTVHRCQ